MKEKRYSEVKIKCHLNVNFPQIYLQIWCKLEKKNPVVFFFLIDKQTLKILRIEKGLIIIKTF